MVDPSSYILFQPMLHSWCNESNDMYYPVCEMVRITDSLLLIESVAHVVTLIGHPLPYVHCCITINKNVLSAS